jgi:antirestriction protein ArdC
LTSLGYSQNLFLTFRQATELGAKIRKGEKGHLVVYTKRIDDLDDESGQTHHRYVLRYYLLFNIDQCENLKPKLIPSSRTINKPYERCERIIACMPNPPKIEFQKDIPFYHPQGDYINMPKMECFDCSESYYETLFHELIHSTGHPDRLYRTDVMQSKFGSELYSKEELTAEIGACFLKSFAGFKDAVRENNTAYLKSWFKVLRNDPRFIVHASAQAQRAVDYIMNAGDLEDTYSML